MARKSSLPLLNRIEFFRSTVENLPFVVASAIEAHQSAKPAGGKLTPKHDALSAWSRVAVDVQNGGFTQFFYNNGGDSGVKPLADLLDELAVPNAGTLLRDASAVYRKHRSKFKTDNPWDGLFGSIDEFEPLERQFWRVQLRASRAIDKWIRTNLAELFVGDDGQPIDLKFSGTIEIKQLNGAVGESLEVKKGKAHGAYREFFEDSSVKTALFYKAGKISGDFWSDGQIKKKVSKRGPITTIEWFYPGGKLHKRLVHDKTGYTVEPIQLFHENGQLAEQITLKNGDETGPWLKFFADGSPQLEAEYKPLGKLIVHNAWADDRTQTVKNGTGIFHKSGFSLNWKYDLFHDGMWSHDIEFQGGRQTGVVKKYACGVLCSVGTQENGVRHGLETGYWDNGRIRTKTQFNRGKAGKSESFPRLDHPVPQVLLRVEANEKLYSTWKHMSVDEYPQVLNLDSIQRQLKIPEFLNDVYQRNLTQTVESEYEDFNTFSDDIAYFLQVDEKGCVSSVQTNVSGIYSGGDMDTYLEFLHQLRFKPGRARGRAVTCQVLAIVDHTFVEDSAKSSKRRR